MLRPDSYERLKRFAQQALEVVDLKAPGYGSVVVHLSDGRIAVGDGKRVQMRWGTPDDAEPRQPRPDDPYLGPEEAEIVNMAIYRYLDGPVRSDPAKQMELEGFASEYFGIHYDVGDDLTSP